MASSDTVLFKNLRMVSKSHYFQTPQSKALLTALSDGLKITDQVAFTSSNANANYDFYQSLQGQSVQWSTSNVALTIPNMVVGLEAKSLASLANNSAVTTWGNASQSTTASKPTYYSSTGHQGGAYVKFVGNGTASGQFMSFPSVTLSFANQGVTAFALVRFDGTTGQKSERIFDFNNSTNASGSMMALNRNGATTAMAWVVGEGTSSLQLLANNAIVQNEWAVWTGTIGSVANTKACLYKNGVVVAQANNTLNFTSRKYTTNVNIGKSSYPSFDNYATMSLGAVYVFDRMLTSTEIATMHGYLLQAASTLNSFSNNYLSLLPFTNNQPLTYPVYAAPSLDFNGSLRIHALPANPIINVDAFTNPSVFTNANKPTFDTKKRIIAFTRTSTQYLSFGSTTFNIVSRGFTAIIRFMFTGTAGSNERLINITNSSSNGGAYDIYLARDGTNQSVSFELRGSNGATTIGSQVIVGNIYNNVIYTIAACYDPTRHGSQQIWVDGVLVRTATGVYTYPADTTYTNVFVGRSMFAADAYLNAQVYNIVLYNTTLTEDELRQVHMVLSTDAANNMLEVGNRTGKHSLVVKNDGNVGIGTHTTGQKLDVYGNIRYNGILIDTVASTANMWLSFKALANGAVATSTVIADDTGNGNTATVTGTGCTITTDTIQGQTMKVLQYVNNGATSVTTNLIANPTSKTVCFWIKTTRATSATDDMAIGFFPTGTNPGYFGGDFAMMYACSGYSDMGFLGYGNDWAIKVGTFAYSNTGAWFHVALTQDENNWVQLFINGVPVGVYYTSNSISYGATATTVYTQKFNNASTLPTAKFQISKWVTTTNNTFNFANIMYFYRVLTEAEIASLYLNPHQQPVIPSLVAPNQTRVTSSVVNNVVYSYNTGLQIIQLAGGASSAALSFDAVNYRYNVLRAGQITVYPTNFTTNQGTSDTNLTWGVFVNGQNRGSNIGYTTVSTDVVVGDNVAIYINTTTRAVNVQMYNASSITWIL
jgi:hypothetical protein